MSTLHPICIPDIGTSNPVTVIEILVSEGDLIAQDESLLTLESEKATMEVPSPMAGVVKNLKVVVGDKVKEGHVIMEVEVSDGNHSVQEVKSSQMEPSLETEPLLNNKTSAVESDNSSIFPIEATGQHYGEVHAGPAVRRMAREFGVDLNRVEGAGPKGRVMKNDVKNYVRETLQERPSKLPLGGIELPPLNPIDFSGFGEVEVQSLSRIKQISGENLHRNWMNIPHVTQFDEADVTAVEAFRQSAKAAAEKRGYKLTPLVFIMKAVVECLKAFPLFNASLLANTNELVLKKYFHLGVAVDTPNGLVVPVIHDVDKKSVFDIAKELAAVSKKAREKGLTPKEMQGHCFTISSLGGIGGTAFTPIINYPDVAILGVSRSIMKPIYDKKTDNFIPRLMVPLSLSYDHRVIDGAEAARFTKYLSDMLTDIGNLIL